MSYKKSENESNREKLKIQDDLPIRTIGIEIERERTNYSDLPPQNYIHIWWTRKPTPASRLGVLASVLPSSVDDDTLLRWMGINPDNISEGMNIAEHVRQKKQTEDNRDGLLYEHFGYRKSYKNLPSDEEMENLHKTARNAWNGELPTVLDATAGGGSIPFESIRYGFPTIANELNPVASIILKAVLEHPRTDKDLSEDIQTWGDEINKQARTELERYFPCEDDEIPLEYIWAHTIECPDCGLTLPLDINWWLDKKSGNEGTAACPEVQSDEVKFSTVVLPTDVEKSDFNPSNGTVSRGKATCLNCSVTIDSDEIKRQAQAGEMGQQLYAIHYESKGKGNNRKFRAPRDYDINGIEKAIEEVEKDIDLATFLSVDIPSGAKTDEPRRNGIFEWRDMYSPRQLLVHYTYWKAFEDVKENINKEYSEEEAKVILTFLALSADKSLDYNSKMCTWVPSAAKMGHSFDRHDLSFKWGFAESNLPVEGLGYEWVLDSTVEVYEELRELAGHSDAPLSVLQEDAASLPLNDKSIDAIVLDPPYYDNVIFSELSDFFYVLLKEYLGDVYPDFFSSQLTPKTEEAVANTSKFKHVANGGQSQKELAMDDFEEKMADILSEMYRVLDDRGIFTLMFTHKKTEAWDTLTKALIKSGFIVTSTHPISTERAESLHQSGKNAAQSTILLSSEKRLEKDNSPTLWSEIKRKTRTVARQKAQQLDEKEIDFAKVDIILASFGPTLEVFTKSYPVIDDEGNEVRPQIALDEARSAVRDYLIDQYLHEGVRDVDRITEWYILAWLVFEVQRFPYDEANRLGKGLGVEVDDIKRSKRLWRKKSDDIVLRSHDERVQTPADKEKSRTTKPIDPDAITFDIDLDKVHAVMYVYDELGLIETEKYIKDRGFDTDTAFRATFEALLKVLSPTHDDWELLRDMALTDIGKLVDLDVDTETFQRGTEDEDEHQQDKLSNYD